MLHDILHFYCILNFIILLYIQDFTSDTDIGFILFLENSYIIQLTEEIQIIEEPLFLNIGLSLKSLLFAYFICTIVL